MRPFVVAGLVLVVIVAGTLGLVGINQNNSEQQRQAAQYQHAVAYETAAVATSDTIGATMMRGSRPTPPRSKRRSAPRLHGQ